MLKKITVILAVAICALAFMLFYSRDSSSRVDSLDTPDSIIPPTLFGMHIHRATTVTPWPAVPFGTWRLWDTYAAWPWLEPEKDKWNFKALDKMVDLASSHRVEVLLPLGLSPVWASARPAEKSAYSPGYAAEPRDMNDWKNYVRTVATRYKGRIHYYEIWNEPNLKEFYSGPVAQMVSLAREAYGILKEIDPTVVVVSPSATGGNNGPDWLDEFLARGGGGYADVIGYHFYVAPHPPEAMAPLIKKVKSLMGRRHVYLPLWNTETGWLIADHLTVVKPEGSGFKSKVLSDSEAESYIARSYVLDWAMGVERLYWYAWDNYIMGLTEADGRTVKPPARAYINIQNWLVGARMEGCSIDRDGTWTCTLSRSGGYEARVAWNPDRSVNLRVEKEWGIASIRTLDGRALPVTGTVEVGASPLLLENKAR